MLRKIFRTLPAKPRADLVDGAISILVFGPPIHYSRAMNREADSRELATGDGTAYSFRPVALRFHGPAGGDAFALKNNKTLAETLAHHRYKGLVREAEAFAASMELPLGEFLVGLKRDGNAFYKRFLTKHGDQSYSTFSIDDPAVLGKKGVYAYYVADELRYIGRCRDTMRQRINQGYGKIHPKNCFIDGQSTNCHLNARITEAGEMVSLWFCPLESDEEISAVEAQLIRRYQPEWNIQKL